jgi:ABC-2 type transport system permease protein
VSAVVRTTEPGFGDALVSELLKIRSARSAKRNLILGAALGIALAALVALGIRLTWDEWAAADRAEYEPITSALVGGVVMAVFSVIVGVGLVTSEYASGMIRLTFTATPRRWRVVAAKALTVAMVTSAASAASSIGMVVAANAVMAGSDVPGVSSTSPTLWETLVRASLVAAAFPVIAVAVAFLLRGVASSLIAVLAIAFGPSVLGAMLPDWWARNVLSLTPSPATDTLAFGHLVESDLDRHPLVALVVVAGWLALFLWLAATRVARADADR